MAGIKHIKIPSPVPILNVMGDGSPFAEGGEPTVIPLRILVLRALEHETFRKTRDAFKSSLALADLAESCRPGEVVPVAGDDLARLKGALDDLSILGWPGWVMRQLRPLFAALEDARDKPDAFDEATEG